MDSVLALSVGAQQWSNEQHAGARGSKQVGRQGAQGQDGGIDARRAWNMPGNQDASGNHIQREQQHDERNELGGSVQCSFGGTRTAFKGADDGEGNQPASGGHHEFVAVGLPPMRGVLEKWQYGDGAKERGEGNDGPRGQVHHGGRDVRGTAATHVIRGICGADGMGGVYRNRRTHVWAG